MSDTISAEWLPVSGPAKQAEPFGFALIFGRHLLHQGKRWKTNTRRIIVRVKKARTADAELLPFYKLRVNWLRINGVQQDSRRDMGAG